jgi:hypothetical protein
MRTTITLDPDVAARIKLEMRRSGRGFKETVNRLLRRGAKEMEERKDEPFRVIARPMGPKPGLNFDKISDLIEQVEGPFYK